MRGRPSMMLAPTGALRPETKALVARMSVAPSKARQYAINRLVGKLVDTGLWQHAAIDAFYVFAAHDAQAARLNWFASNSATTVGGPAFTADLGYAGDGEAAYLSCLNPTGALDDHHLGIFLQSGAVIGSIGGAYGWSNMASTAISSKSGDSAQATTATTGLRHGVMNRVVDTSFKHYRNGSLLASPANPVGSSYTGLARVLYSPSAGGDIFSAGRVAAFHYGQGLTDQQVADLYAALNPYMIEVGAA